MRTRRGVMAALAVGAVAGASGVGTALAGGGQHIIRSDADDNGNRVISVRDLTRYDGTRRWAISKWSARERVRFVYTNSTARAELSFDDYRKRNRTIAYYRPFRGRDVIRFNAYNMDRFGIRNKRWAGTHELGHALGLGDHYDKSRYGRIVMFGYNNQVQTPQPHDKHDYRRRWP